MDFKQFTYRDLLQQAHSFADEKDISSLNEIKQELSLNGLKVVIKFIRDDVAPIIGPLIDNIGFFAKDIIKKGIMT